MSKSSYYSYSLILFLLGSLEGLQCAHSRHIYYRKSCPCVEDQACKLAHLLQQDVTDQNMLDLNACVSAT